MELLNPTPLPGLAFRQFDQNGELDCVVTLRGTFEHVQNGPACSCDQQMPLQWQDVYVGDPLSASRSAGGQAAPDLAMADGRGGRSMSIPKDGYIGEPGYPAPWTTSTPREGLRDTDQARIISLAPDVCRSPSVPVPYPVVDFCGHDENYTPSVRFTGQKAMVMRSSTSHVHGDEPGTGKGIKSGTVGGISEPITHAAQVRAEGSHVIRHLDRFHMNNRNTVGEAVFVRDTRIFAAPKDDDPLPGSIVMSDASPEPLIMGAQYAQALEQPKRLTTTPLNIPESRPNTTLPRNMPPAANDNVYQRRGTFGQPSAGAAARILNMLGLAAAGYQLGDMAGRWYVGQDAVMGRAIADRLRSQVSVASDQAKYIADLPWHWGADTHINNANDLLSLKAGYKVDYRTMDPAELEELLQEPWPSAEQLEKNARTREKSRTAPVSDNVRVDEDEERPRCKVQRICFMPVSPNVDRAEFRRQLKLQERALNAMTPGEMLGNRGAYLANPEGMRKLSEPLQARTRAEYRASKEREYAALYGSRARAEINAHMKAVAALHNPDMIAGGAYTSVADPSISLQDRIGGLNENSSMGSQWQGGRAQRLANHAMEQQRNGCPSVQVILEVCVDPGR